MANKRLEKRCLHITKSNLQWLRRYKNISAPEQEKPDFILSDGVENIGLEHFLVDTLWNNGSQTRKAVKRIGHAGERYENGEDAGTVFEDIAGSISDCFLAYDNFSYDTFLNNFRRIFDKHLKNVRIYKENKIEKIGFLIEITVLDFDYIVETMDKELLPLHIKGIPITKGIWDIINRFNEIDFVVITVLKINSNKNKSYYFDKDHVPQEMFKSFSFEKPGNASGSPMLK